jgi:hypothetical protein
MTTFRHNGCAGLGLAQSVAVSYKPTRYQAEAGALYWSTGVYAQCCPFA